MSYSRFGEGDLYLFLGAKGFICCSCLLAPKDYADMILGEDPQSALDHVNQHIDAGHHVPARCTARLEDEIRNASSGTKKLL